MHKITQLLLSHFVCTPSEPLWTCLKRDCLKVNAVICIWKSCSSTWWRVWPIGRSKKTLLPTWLTSGWTMLFGADWHLYSSVLEKGERLSNLYAWKKTGAPALLFFKTTFYAFGKLSKFIDIQLMQRNVSINLESCFWPHSHKFSMSFSSVLLPPPTSEGNSWWT